MDVPGLRDSVEEADVEQDEPRADDGPVADAPERQPRHAGTVRTLRAGDQNTWKPAGERKKSKYPTAYVFHSENRF